MRPRRPARASTALALAATGAGLLLAGCGTGAPRQVAAPPVGAASPAASGAPSPDPSAGTPGPPPSVSAEPPPPPPAPALPDGTRTVLPDRRVVAYYGTPSGGIQRDILDRLSPEEAAKQVTAAAAPFATPGRPVLPAFEVIATIAQGSPGADGTYSSAYDDDKIQRYLDVARANRMLVILDLQPGQGDFLSDAKHFQKFLEQPDVGLALDSEWNMPKGVVPGTQFGSVSADTVNQVSQWLAGIVAAKSLPQKLFVLHTFEDSMITNRGAIVQRPGLATVIHLDGFGGQAAKKSKYASLHATAPGQFNGFKLFYQDDIKPMMTPKQVLALTPPPDLITYQ